MHYFWKHKLDHIIFWIGTVGFHMYIRSGLIQSAGFGQFALEVLIRNILLAAIIYTNLIVFIPRFARKQKVVLYFILLAASVLFYASIKNLHDVYLYGDVLGQVEQRSFFRNSFYNVSIAVFYLAFSVGLTLSREWYIQQDIIRKIEVEKLNTELAYLKSQINPHFLFNSINTIYFQIDKSNEGARESLSAFSEMLRYQLYECNERYIPIEKEVSYLKNYIELQRKRKSESYSVSFFVSQDVHGFNISPLVLIPFVENSFKHVSNHLKKNEITIEMTRDHEYFRLNVFNTKDNNIEHTTKNGIGLRNVQRRLDLIYQSDYELLLKSLPETFEVTLLLPISYSV